MSTPRKPYGPNPPGRLFATMIKVLAAELSDQGRLARGKRYWADDAVVDIVVGHGAVTAEVQGGRAEPYVVTIEAAGGSGVPSKRELWVQCTCPDDAGTGTEACKHAVAAMFTLSDEVAIEPTLVDRWRHSARPARQVDDPVGDPAGGVGPVVGSTAAERLADRRRQRDDADDGRVADVIELHPRADPEAEAISMLLRAPDAARLPDLPDVDELQHAGLRDPLLADVLDDALDHLGIRWE